MSAKDSTAVLQAALLNLGWSGITEAGGWCPFQIQGTLHGEEVYVRERHDMYTIELIRDGKYVLVDTGDYYTLYGPSSSTVHAATFATSKVLDYLRAEGCPHDANTRFCPDCGTRLIQD